MNFESEVSSLSLSCSDPRSQVIQLTGSDGRYGAEGISATIKAEDPGRPDIRHIAYLQRNST